MCPPSRQDATSGARNGHDRASPVDVLGELLSLSEASELSGIAAHTLTQQAKRGRLRARLIGHTWVTTREAVDEYVASHARKRAALSGHG